MSGGGDGGGRPWFRKTPLLIMLGCLACVALVIFGIWIFETSSIGVRFPLSWKPKDLPRPAAISTCSRYLCRCGTKPVVVRSLS
jgi:hypothetical protein